jgi:hypothetical protein
MNSWSMFGTFYVSDTVLGTSESMKALVFFVSVCFQRLYRLAGIRARYKEKIVSHSENGVSIKQFIIYKVFSKPISHLGLIISYSTM